MHNEAIFDYLIYNGAPFCTDDPLVESIIHQRSVYEVIRLVDGIPLYYEEHLDRLYHSAKLSGITLCIDPEMIDNVIRELVNLNKQYNANIKLLFSEDGNSYFAYFMHTFYPPATMFTSGVSTILYDEERPNPNAKINEYQVRSRITADREAQNAFEALLVNHNGNITEGSRTNVFFADDTSLYTAPSGKVLIGITRLKVIELCKKVGIPLQEIDIPVSKLSHFSGAFLTSTSNDVLPIHYIDDLEFASSCHPLIIKIQQAYQQDKQANLIQTASNWQK